MERLCIASNGVPWAPSDKAVFVEAYDFYDYPRAGWFRQGKNAFFFTIDWTAGDPYLADKTYWLITPATKDMIEMVSASDWFDDWSFFDSFFELAEEKIVLSMEWGEGLQNPKIIPTEVLSIVDYIELY